MIYVRLVLFRVVIPFAIGSALGRVIHSSIPLIALFGVLFGWLLVNSLPLLYPHRCVVCGKRPTMPVGGRTPTARQERLRATIGWPPVWLRGARWFCPDHVFEALLDQVVTEEAQNDERAAPPLQDGNGPSS